MAPRPKTLDRRSTTAPGTAPRVSTEPSVTGPAEAGARRTPARRGAWPVLGGAVALVLAGAPAPASAAPPEVTRQTTVDTFADEFIAAVCGIEVTTTSTEKRVTQTFPDGRQRVHVTATIVSDDPRVSIERDSFTDHVAADGTVTVTGVALRLIDPSTGRTVVKDRGRVVFSPEGTVLSVAGPHPTLAGVDPASIYCPSLG